MTELVLPRRTAKLVEDVPRDSRNPGLQLDKLSIAGRNQEEQAVAIDVITHCTGDSDLLRALLERRKKWLVSLCARRFKGRTLGPMTLHLSRSGALENAGIALHPVCGFAYLPGTGIKGMTRAWAETVWAQGESDYDEAFMRIRAVFGTAPGSGKSKSGIPDESATGRIVFHDAWPVNWPLLERDIINNHHKEYYQGMGDPGDWENPSIVSFLSIAAGTEFDFAISARAQADDDLARIAADWLRAALLYDGAGAKTAAGYGRIVPTGGVRPPSPEALLRSEYRLELASPAFLAGARQEEGDCDLRPATLRGLLRWWWRTMHAGHLARGDLAKLEALVWGNTDAGSSVAVAVELENSQGPAKQYSKIKIKQGHQLENPRNQKVIQGLYYASYGMNEQNNRSRFYRDAGDCWRLVLTGRSSTRDSNGGGKIKVPAELLMQQAQAALWLLTRYGGAGSRSRKGFGSFCHPEIDSIQSIEDCIEAGQRFRKFCGIASKEPAESPALEKRIGPIEFPTGLTDPWCAIDWIGGVYQVFVKSLAPACDRQVLGLPRKVGGQNLTTAKGGERHASPAHWSISRNADKTLTVRLIAFPSARLPDRDTSRRVLKDYGRSREARIR